MVTGSRCRRVVLSCCRGCRRAVGSNEIAVPVDAPDYAAVLPEMQVKEPKRNLKKTTTQTQQGISALLVAVRVDVTSGNEPFLLYGLGRLKDEHRGLVAQVHGWVRQYLQELVISVRLAEIGVVHHVRSFWMSFVCRHKELTATDKLKNTKTKI